MDPFPFHSLLGQGSGATIKANIPLLRKLSLPSLIGRFGPLKILLCQPQDHLPHLCLSSYWGFACMPLTASVAVRSLLPWNESRERIQLLIAHCQKSKGNRVLWEGYPEKTVGNGIRIFILFRIFTSLSVDEVWCSICVAESSGIWSRSESAVVLGSPWGPPSRVPAKPPDAAFRNIGPPPRGPREKPEIVPFPPLRLSDTLWIG